MLNTLRRCALSGLALSIFFIPLQSPAQTEITPEQAKKLNQALAKWPKPSHEEEMELAKLFLAQLDSLEAALQREVEAGRIRRPGDNAQAVAAYNSGVRLTILGRKEDALRSYSEALRIDPTYYPAHFGRQRIFLSLAMWAEAQVEFKKAIALKSL